MSSKKDEKALAAAERLKGVSRVQSEKAAASATRNVNAYGQKEGPSLRQVKKERLRAMYEYSTEKAVVLGERKGRKNLADTSDSVKQCQNCLRNGHWSYECENERAYVSRPSQTKQIKNPRLKRKLSVSYDGNPDILPPPEEEKDEKDSKKSNSKRHQHSDSRSDTGSDSSVVTGSDSSPGMTRLSKGSFSELEEKRGMTKKSYKKRKHHKYSSTSESSDSYSDSDSGSDKEEERKRRKKKSYKKKKHHKYSSTSESSDSYSDSDSGSDRRSLEGTTRGTSPQVRFF